MSPAATPAELRCQAGLHPVPSSSRASRGCSACGRLAARGQALKAILACQPDLPPDRARVALERAAPALLTLQDIAAHLNKHPDAWRSGNSDVPAGVAKLIGELRAAGSLELVLPRCADCGRQAELKSAGPGGRVCGRCAHARRTATCEGCGRERPIAGRGMAGECLCKTCRTKEPGRWGRCGERAPIDAIEHGVEIGRCCYVRPVRRCRICGVRRRIADGKRPLPHCADCARRPHTSCSGCGGPAALPRTGEPARCAHCAHRPPKRCTGCGALTIALDAAHRPCCERCYERPVSVCGRCGRQRPIARLTSGDEPALCDSCYRGPVVACAGCGRLRPCHGVRAGLPLCEACRPDRLRTCAHCGEQRRITANWPEGPVCRACWKRALAAKAGCPGCGQRRRLLTYEGFAKPLCCDCAGVPPVHVCQRCGAEEPVYEHGCCARCALAGRLVELLGDNQRRGELGLAPLYKALTNARSPEHMIRWLATSEGAAILRRIGNGELACSYEALDLLPASRAVRHLEHLLAASGTLPPRDPALARLERFTAELLASDEAQPFERILRPYADWVVLRPLRNKSRQAPITDGTIQWARRDLRTALNLLTWLADHDRPLGECGQADIDRWLANHPTTRHSTRRFVRWLEQRRLTTKLDVPAGKRERSGVALSADDRAALARRLLLAPRIETGDRVAGALLVLYAQPLDRISRLTRDHVPTEDGQTWLRLGPTPLRLAEPLAGHVRDLAAHDQARPPSPSARRPNAVTVTDTIWLFPGQALGRPLGPRALGDRLRKHGIQCDATRRAALLQLCAEIPAPVVADLLGLHINTAVRWAGLAGRSWADYLTSRADAAAPQPDTRTQATV